MKLVTLKNQHHTAWDRFVRQEGSVFHLTNWIELIESTYGFRAEYYFWEQDGSIAGVLPGFLVKRPFAGSAYISNPFAVSAGPLCLQGTEVPIEVISAALQKLSIDYIELRDYQIDLDDWVVRTGFSNFEKRLESNHETNFMAIPNRQRAVLKKGEKAQLEIDVHHDLERFLSVYETSLRNLGTPIYAKRYFQGLQHYLRDNLLIASVRRDGEDLTSVLCFTFQEKLMPYYGGGTPQARDYHAFPWMYWQLMKLGVDRHLPVFDFGRSPTDSGAYQFKKNLGFEPRTMPYSFLPINSEPPDLSHSSLLVTRLTSLWKFMPIPLARLIGPIGSVYAV